MAWTPPAGGPTGTITDANGTVINTASGQPLQVGTVYDYSIGTQPPPSGNDVQFVVLTSSQLSSSNPTAESTLLSAKARVAGGVISVGFTPTDEMRSVGTVRLGFVEDPRQVASGTANAWGAGNDVVSIV